jgi:hypothetical protein
MLHKLRQRLDPSARDILVVLLNAPFVDRDKLINNPTAFITFLQQSGYITDEGGVEPLLDILTQANDKTLSSIITVLKEYQQPLAYDPPQWQLPNQPSKDPQEIVFEKLSKRGKPHDKALEKSKYLSNVKLLMEHLWGSFVGTEVSIYLTKAYNIRIRANRL